MAELYLARAETELGATRLAAVKVVLPAFAGEPEFAEMLIHEAKLAARLSHRHIVNVLDLGSDDGCLYIAMEYVEGLDLNALLRLCSERDEGLPAQHALGIVADILDGLDHAHRKRTEDGEPLGIVHRDVSPSNVLISYEGEVKLCDFGIARANDVVMKQSEGESESETQANGGGVKGKASYMSPEHARGEELDARSDVFAAGIILWELLAGRRLYRPRADMPLLEQARQAEIPALPDRGLPHARDLERIVTKALAFDRDRRYASAAAYARDLEDYLARCGMLSSRLKLGEWMANTFGTALVDKRRASERALPKSSAPPPRSSGAVRVKSTPDVVIPAAPRVPTDLMRGGPRAGAGYVVDSSVVPAAALSLEGASMDIPPSSREVVEPDRDSRSPPNFTDDELLAWAKRRGWVSLAFFAFIAAGIFLAWMLTR
jgi:serine/threonine-protein kinase